MENIDQLRAYAIETGFQGFVAGDLKVTDVESMSWSGDSIHLQIVMQQLADGDSISDTIGIYSPEGIVVSKGYVTHDPIREESTISQLATHPKLQSIGLGSRLMTAIEARVLRRNINKALLAVEQENPRARKLYERLGYSYIKSGSDSWEAIDRHGNSYTHKTTVDWLSKNLK